MDALNHIPDGIFIAMLVAGVVILAVALAWGTTHYRARRKDGAEIAPGGEVGHNYAADKPRRDTPPRRRL
jgi:heme/copper-type cytochrome/quinol oxidase subunit 2